MIPSAFRQLLPYHRVSAVPVFLPVVPVWAWIVLAVSFGLIGTALLLLWRIRR